MTMYANEIDLFAAEWLRNLFPEAVIDPRSIKDVRPKDLEGYTRCHFFAGIGGWEYALQLAGWSATRPVFTGSCPCQPYSAAGKKKGDADARNLWPDFFRLIRECRPDTVISEQVDGAIGYGWLDGVFADLESEGYSCGATVLGAHSVTAPHRRQRVFWVATLPNGNGRRLSQFGQSDSEPSQSGQQASRRTNSGGRDDVVSRADSVGTGLEGFARDGHNGDESGQLETQPPGPVATSGTAAPWDDFAVVHCLDGKPRRVPTQPELFPVVNGIPRELDHFFAWLEGRGMSRKDARRLLRGSSQNRKGRLMGAGNAIVPQLAAEFIRAFMDVEEEIHGGFRDSH